MPPDSPLSNGGFVAFPLPVEESHCDKPPGLVQCLPLSDAESTDRDVSESDTACLENTKQPLSSEPSAASHESSPVLYTSPIASGHREEGILNPFQLRPENLLLRDEAYDFAQSLRHNAIDLSLHVLDAQRSELFFSAMSFAAMFTEELCPGRWKLCERTENAPNSKCIRFVKKFRLRAATKIDRAERIRIALFDKFADADALGPLKGLGYAEFRVDDLIAAKQMILKKPLKEGERGAKAKGRLLMALELVRHSENNETVTFDFGFLDGAPVRKRMFFVLSRALRMGRWSPVYNSEVRTREDSRKFDPVVLTTQEFNGAEASRLFRLEVYRYYKNGKSRLLGFMQTTFAKLCSMEVNGQLYWWPAQGGLTSAKVVVESSNTSTFDRRFSLRLAGVGT